MRRRSTRKKSAVDLLETPPIPVATESPEEFEFNLDAFRTSPLLNPPASTTKKKKNILESSGVKLAGASKSSPATTTKTLSSVSDLKEMASSRLDSIKRQLERSHSEILKDIEASQSRLQKRLKIQMQSCQKVMGEAEREYKKISERISEGREAMKASYTEFVTEIQASASGVFKTSLPELSQSFEKAIDSLRSRYGIASTSAC